MPLPRNVESRLLVIDHGEHGVENGVEGADMLDFSDADYVEELGMKKLQLKKLKKALAKIGRSASATDKPA